MTGAHKILYWCSRGSIHTFPLSWNVICYQTSCTTFFFFSVSEKNSWWSSNLRRADFFCHLENVVLMFWYTFQRSGLRFPFANIVVVSEFESKYESNSNWYIWVHRHIVAYFTHLFYIFSLLSERMLGFSKWPCIVMATGREITSLLFLEFIPHYKLSWPATTLLSKMDDRFSEW